MGIGFRPYGSSNVKWWGRSDVGSLGQIRPQLPAQASPIAFAAVQKAQDKLEKAKTAAKGIIENFEEVAAVFGLDKAKELADQASDFLDRATEEVKEAEERL